MANVLVYTASTISFTAATKTIADSASGLNLIVNTKVAISGSGSNNGTFTIVTASAAAVTVTETVVNESAGSAITITVTTPLPYATREIAAVVAGVTGIHQAPANPNETQNDFPFAAIYVSTGNLGAGPIGTRKSLYNIAVDVLTNRIDLAHDLEILLPFLDTVPAALIAEVSGSGDKFSNTISTFDEITMQFIPQVDYAGVQMIGYRFILSNVKILSNT